MGPPIPMWSTTRDVPEDIPPQLRTVALSEIAAAAGCSKASASDIRRGKWAPHVSTWRVLVAFGQVGPGFGHAVPG